MNIDTKNKRKKIRFEAEPNTLALISFNHEAKKFTPEIIALVLEESIKGYKLVAVQNREIMVGEKLKIKINNLPIFFVEIRWIKKIEKKVISFGVLIIE